jgi:aquaporin Z
MAKDVPKYLSEFIGTYILVLTIGCNVLGGVSIWAVTSIACALMVMIYALGGVSGAHFNPAVTLAITLSNKLESKLPVWQQAGLYMVSQVAAGTLAAFTYLLIFLHNFNLEPGKGFSMLEASVAEFIYTFMLCFVVLNAACSSAQAGKNQFYGLAIGFVIVAGGYAVGSISGGAFNPAVALGVDLASVNRGFGYCIIYVLVEFAAAAAAAGLFRFVRPEDFGGQAKTQTAKLLSEFIGTYMLVVTVGFNVLTGSAAAAFSIAAALMCMIYALGDVSGAHFNPAVTFSLWLSGRDQITWKDALEYVVAQLLGGIAASFTYATVMGKAFPLGPVAGYNWFSAALGEVIFTAVLCFVVLSVASVPKKPAPEFIGLAIGSCVTVGGFAVGGISGGSLNPAVSVALDLANAGKSHMMIGSSLAYTLFELTGAGLATAAFYTVQPDLYAKGALLKK